MHTRAQCVRSTPLSGDTRIARPTPSAHIQCTSHLLAHGVGVVVAAGVCETLGQLLHVVALVLDVVEHLVHVRGGQLLRLPEPALGLRRPLHHGRHLAVALDVHELSPLALGVVQLVPERLLLVLQDLEKRGSAAPRAGHGRHRRRGVYLYLARGLAEQRRRGALRHLEPELLLLQRDLAGAGLVLLAQAVAELLELHCRGVEQLARLRPAAEFHTEEERRHEVTKEEGGVSVPTCRMAGRTLASGFLCQGEGESC